MRLVTNMKKHKIWFVLILFLCACSSNSNQQDKEIQTSYLIPSNYEGSIILFYDVPNEKKLLKKGNEIIIPIQLRELDALKGLNISNYGVFFTSDSYIPASKDSFYYTDNNGQKKKIDKECIFYSGNGFFSGASDITIRYKVFQLTRTKCSSNFRFNGTELYNTQFKEIKSFWMSHFD
jgi:hypothetical protein